MPPTPIPVYFPHPCPIRGRSPQVLMPVGITDGCKNVDANTNMDNRWIQNFETIFDQDSYEYVPDTNG